MSESMPNFDESLKGIEQGRAKFAYKCVEEVLKTNYKSDYKSYVKRVPMLIKTNGLGATYAFIFSKKDKESGAAYKKIYDDTVRWLNWENRGLIDLSEKDGEKGNELVKKIIELNSSEYRAVTIEILLFFEWLRRFAEVMIKE